MPNHIHGIMIIDNQRDRLVVETGFKPVSTTTVHGIFEFVRALKTFSSRRMNELDKTPGKPRWQPQFHDRIIRNAREFYRKQRYILNNPSNWNKDSLK